ncbi:MAG: acetylxylan esterase [Phycisphaerae bacterium]|nr:acetylxylan esterase [Phycisphaerae bacterium]
MMISQWNFHRSLGVVWAASLCLGITVVSGSSANDHETFILTPQSAQKAPNSDGFIQLWHLLEPISASGETQNAVQATVKTEHFPGQFTVVPKDGDKVTVNGTELTWHDVDTNKYNINLYYFAQAHRKSPSGALFWAVTVINCPEEMAGVRLAVGSNSASVWWVNDKEVIGIYGNRQTVVDDGISKRLTLKKGRNVIRGAIVNGSGAADFCARILDREGKPLKNFTIHLN